VNNSMARRRNREPGEVAARSGQVISLILIGLSLGCGNKGTTDKVTPDDHRADIATITQLVEQSTQQADRAWNARDARLMFADSTGGTVVRTPEGQDINREAMIADLQRRMDMTTRIDTMSTVVDSVLFPAADTAIVYSSQRFVRMMVVPGQPERQRISSVTHRQRFYRVAGAWSPILPIEELNPQAYWADEKQ
jgi:hypothetical protein